MTDSDESNYDSLNESETHISDQSDQEDSKQELESKSIKLSNAISKILNSSTTDDASNNKQSNKKPILSNDKSIEKSLANHKLEVKAKKALAMEKKKWMNKERVIPSMIQEQGSSLVHEKMLRKTATRGVVQLFNAIQAAQKKMEASPSSTSIVSSSSIIEKKKETKSTFLKMLKSSQ